MPTIELDHITKVEGHAKLKVKVDGGVVTKCQLEVFEGARYFEGILQGRRYDEAPHLTSRICGVCSQAHLITALQAIENALGVDVSPQTRLLRELLLLGQMIQSHALHLYLLVLPDYMGFESAIAMAAKYPKHIQRALNIKKLGNDICTLIGAREVHSITAVPGGFSKIPSQKELDSLLERIKKQKGDIVKAAELFAEFKYPDYQRPTEYVALQKEDEYALMDGTINSTEGLCISKERYLDYFQENIQEYSTAKFVVSEGKGYMVGSLARINLNQRMLSSDARKLIDKSKFDFPNYNPFLNNFAQAVEMVHFTDRAIDILENIRIRKEDPVDFKLRAGRGVAATEVPRGTLYHDYELDDKGDVVHANIITPTTQNLKNCEDDIKGFLPTILKKSQKQVVSNIEMLIRAYDPCISCSTHFLDVEWE
ncbi:MAG: Ni/Fe hydrogenase subunit alpha [Candidatus Altiarchaeota archaeon]